MYQVAENLVWQGEPMYAVISTELEDMRIHMQSDDYQECEEYASELNFCCRQNEAASNSVL